ncbi:uncharacterized protein LOC119354790 isoform X2 [Triticum dicoccoides]|uniref:uncharacterized protein LOC119354790 isoform X2 n=1 Tax=Triticum dicoccoides TaxID=85692 RepID=UPI000E7C7C2C|nr:uncharacterized protein LOC119354790 isoform X2 [Triticum dicoccoides]XP_044457132.1 uncharacterized protein LOC123188917 isoform X2 [Triticum aestivum]
MTYKVMEERCSEKELYMCQVLKYEDPVRQEAAVNMVPVDELKEKALISLAKETCEKGGIFPSASQLAICIIEHLICINFRHGVERRPRRAWLMSTREAGSSTEDETQDSRSLSCFS